MEIIRKKFILWISVASAMAVVLAIWAMSWKSYNFSQSVEQVKEFKDQAQEKIQEIKQEVEPEKPKLMLPLLD